MPAAMVFRTLALLSRRALGLRRTAGCTRPNRRLRGVQVNQVLACKHLLFGRHALKAPFFPLKSNTLLTGGNPHLFDLSDCQ